MLGFRIEMFSGDKKVAEVRTPAMAFALVPLVRDAKVMCMGKVLYNAKTDGEVKDVTAWARIVAPRYNAARFGDQQMVVNA